MTRPRPPKRPARTSSPVVHSNEESRATIVLTPDEQLAFWRALNAPPTLTEAQRQLGAMMRGEGG